MREIIGLVEREAEDQRSREKINDAFGRVSKYLSDHEDDLAYALSPCRQGDFMLRGSKVGLSRNLLIIFSHSGHHSVGTTGPYDVIIINCLLKAGSLQYLPTRFASGGRTPFEHEFAHYLSRGRAFSSTADLYAKQGDQAYYNHKEEVNAYYQEAALAFERFIKAIVEHLPGAGLERYRAMGAQDLLTLMKRTCLSKEFVRHANDEAMRRFVRRALRFIEHTIRPILAQPETPASR